MSDWNKRSTNTAYRDEIEAREASSEDHVRTILHRSPPYDPLHDNAERLRRIVGRVLEQMPEQDYDEEGRPLDPPVVFSYGLAIELRNAHRASMGEVGR